MKTKLFKPREAMAFALRLGWTVEPKHRTGEIRYTAPNGDRFVSQAPGRKDRVPCVLAKQLTLAEAAHEARQEVVSK